MHRRNRRNGRNDGRKSGDSTQNITQLPSDSPVLTLFQQYSSELDSKHDKFERIVKLGRDTTIESKRIIFLLHTLDRDDKREAVLSEAEKRLTNLENTLFKSIGKELVGEDPFMYIRAFTFGLQEYIEASTFYQYLKSNKLEEWKYVQERFVYQTTDQHVELLVPQSEYILGVADLTGELMRFCINSVGSGQLESCMRTCAFVKEIYNGFLGIGNSGSREFFRKLHTLKQSLDKMENACYAIHVRGSEMPKNMLADVFKDSGAYGEGYEEDEGFF